MTFTKEQLINQAREEVAFWRERDELIPSQQTAIRLRLAEAALAALTAEPVAYMYKDNLHTDARFSLHTRFGNWSQEDINEYEITEIPLYAAPPAPVVPEEIDWSYFPGEHHEEFADGWNTCRAAMLQGAEPTKAGLTLREGLAAIRNSGIAIDAGKIKAERDALNAPVIPDGYALVPVEPTEDMIIAGFEAELREEFRDPDAWEAYEAMSGCEQAALRAKWCWAAMVAAAPQQEVK